MENAVLKASGGSALQCPLTIGERCIVGPHAYVVGATIGDGCFVAGGARSSTGDARRGLRRRAGRDRSRESAVKAGQRPDAAHRLRRSATIYRRRRRRSHARSIFRRRLQSRRQRRRARAAETYAKFCERRTRRTPLEEHRNVKPPPRPFGRRAAADASRRRSTRSSTS